MQGDLVARLYFKPGGTFEIGKEEGDAADDLAVQIAAARRAQNDTLNRTSSGVDA